MGLAAPNYAFFRIKHTDQSESLSEEDRVQVQSVDVEYWYDRPKVYLGVHELARLTLLRSRLGDTQAEREAELIDSSFSMRTGSDLNVTHSK